MKVEVEVPTQFQGGVTGDISSRRGYVTGSDIKPTAVVITAEVPLANMFGYATELRSMTQGQATFSMEFHCFRRTPSSVQEEVIARVRKEKEKRATNA
jgi:elongation factor G